MRNKIIKRFFKKVHKTSTCWFWKGAVRGGSCRYGNIRFGKKRILAHRLSWKIHFGIIPKNKYILHKCDNSICVNPNHLFMGTLSDNNKDRTKKNRSARGENHSFHLYPELVKRGEECHFAKLTETQVKEIRIKYIPWEYSIYKLANEYNVSIGCIYPIIKRKTWKTI